MTAVTPARRAAFAVVRRVFEQGAYADRALHGEAKGLEPRERALAMQLAYGTVQRRLTLDHLIEQLAQRPATELDAPTLAALRLGLYQLVFLDGVAAHAAVGESVELAKGGRSGGHKLVNAVLRRAARGELPALPADDTPAGASLAHSYPRWLVDLWWERFGADETRALLRAGNEPGELALRVNTLRSSPDEVVAALERRRRARRARSCPRGSSSRAPSTPTPTRSGGRAPTRRSRAARCSSRGRSIRSPASACSTSARRPGGKTTHLAALMGDRGEIVAVERHAGRARALQRTCERMGATCVQVQTADAARFVADDPFDRVLVDPPCSGLGTLQGHPDLRWRMSPEAIERLACAQAAILEAGSWRAAPGRRARLRDLHAVAGRERAPARRKRAAGRVRATRAAPPRRHRRLLHRPPAQMMTTEIGITCPNCKEPWLRPANLPGRYRCVYCLHRFELCSLCPDCGEHSTIVRMSKTAILSCNACSASMLREI